MCESCQTTNTRLGNTSESNTVGICPACGQKGKKVYGTTIKSMLAVSLRMVQDTQYLFCQQPDCKVVYFSEDGSQTFTTVDVRERVYQKEPHTGDVFICYCFHHTSDAIRQDLLENRTSTVIGDINTGIAAGQCACDWRNPQGSCCLGNVRNFVKQIENEANIIPLMNTGEA